MGCRKLDTEFCDFLAVMHAEKRHYAEKKCINRFYAERSRSNPFGLEHKGYNNVVNGAEHPYGFGGKEENDELGLEWLDFGARNYDASLGRWMNLDPLAEMAPNWTPYRSFFNNPIVYTDPTGLFEDGFGRGDQDIRDQDIGDQDRGDQGESDGNCCPDYDDGELDEVIITISRGNNNWNTEAEDYDTNLTRSQWTERYQMNPSEYSSQDYVNYVNRWRRSAGEDRLRAFNGRFKFFFYDMGTLDALQYGIGAGGVSALARSSRTFNPNFGLVGSKPVVNSATINKAFRIQYPNALNQVKPGYSDAVNGSSLRTGRGPMIDYPTHKPAIRDYNSKNLNKLGRNGMRVTGAGLSGLSLYYYYEKSKKSK